MRIIIGLVVMALVLALAAVFLCTTKSSSHFDKSAEKTPPYITPEDVEQFRELAQVTTDLRNQCKHIIDRIGGGTGDIFTMD